MVVYQKSAYMDFNQLFPDNREIGETTLRQCQLVMLRILKILDYLCNKHQIRYFLTGGSMLGAIRHHGFIPWDDDLDVGMTRENFEKFVKYAVPELPDDIFFQTSETDIHFPNCIHVDAKLRDKYSSYDDMESKNKKWHKGLQVDIFVYDKAFFPNKLLIILQNKILRLLKNNTRRAKLLKWISKYSPFSHVYASNYFQSFSVFLKIGAPYRREKEASNLMKTRFEDMQVYITTEWDTCLKRQYGNYMQLPPLEKQKGHHSESLPDPFHPCDHKEILHWKERKSAPAIS